MALFIIAMQVIHTYIMIWPSEMWAGYNPFMIMASIYHYYGGVCFLLYLFNEPTYTTDYPMLRHINSFCSFYTCWIYSIGVAYEIYLLWFTQDDVIMTLYAAYQGYLLISYSTLLPQAFLDIVKEQVNDPQFKHDQE